VAASTPFTSDLYDLHIGISRRSADTVIPHVVEVLGQPRSVLDVGCGAGAWLAGFRDAGVGELVGLEGGHPSAEQLQVAPDIIRTFDLQSPFDLGRRFDLVVSVEVAEHLPETSAAAFVGSLCRHGEVILFSAAVPGQGGSHHVNEQWPPYWAELFRAEGYECFDLLRPHLWTNPDVEWWYRQNLLLFAGGSVSRRLQDSGRQPGAPLPLVHPSLFDIVLGEAFREPGLRESASGLVNGVRRRLRRGDASSRP
jgi:SAM-dependent methyltransferase